MKVTIEISDALFDVAMEVAAREKTGLANLIEQGLRQMVSASETRHAFRLRNASYQGCGLSSDAKGLDWEQLRNRSYGALGR